MTLKKIFEFYNKHLTEQETLEGEILANSLGELCWQFASSDSSVKEFEDALKEFEVMIYRSILNLMRMEEKVYEYELHTMYTSEELSEMAPYIRKNLARENQKMDVLIKRISLIKERESKEDSLIF